MAFAHFPDLARYKLPLNYDIPMRSWRGCLRENATIIRASRWQEQKEQKKNFQKSKKKVFFIKKVYFFLYVLYSILLSEFTIKVFRKSNYSNSRFDRWNERRLLLPLQCNMCIKKEKRMKETNNISNGRFWQTHLFLRDKFFSGKVILEDLYYRYKRIIM